MRNINLYDWRNTINQSRVAILFWRVLQLNSSPLWQWRSLEGCVASGIILLGTRTWRGPGLGCWCWCQWGVWSIYTLRKKSATWNPFCPVFRTLGENGSQKGSLHVQEPKKVPYITNNDSKEPKKVLKMGLKTHLEPSREPLKVPSVGQPNNLFFSKSV